MQCLCWLTGASFLFVALDRAGIGKPLWRERVPGTYYGSPVCAGDHVYGVSREGQVVVVAAAKQVKVVARNSLGEGSHSTPAVADGTMHLRTFSHLLAIRSRGPPIAYNAYQSLPSGSPSRGSQACAHVVPLIPAVTNRTLPSPMQTVIPPTCGDCARLESQPWIQSGRI